MSESTRGEGGSYVIDPRSGEKRLVERTGQSAPAPAPETKPAAAVPASKPTKTKD